MTDSNVLLNGGGSATSSSLLSRLKAQDGKAWERFVSLYGSLVYRWCRRSGLQQADAADVGQDVFKAVAGAIAAYRHDRTTDTFRGWLRTITRNKVRDFHQRKAREVPVNGVGVETLPLGLDAAEDESADREERDLVRGRAIELILSECEERSRAVFLKLVVDGQRAGLVAAEFGMTANAVYQIRKRIVRKFREEYAGLIEP